MCVLTGSGVALAGIAPRLRIDRCGDQLRPWHRARCGPLCIALWGHSEFSRFKQEPQGSHPVVLAQEGTTLEFPHVFNRTGLLTTDTTGTNETT